MRAIAKLMAGAAAVLAMAAGSAQAAVYIGYSTNGGAIITTAADLDPNPDSALFTGSIGVFSVNLITGSSGIAPNLLNSTTSNTTSTGAGVLDIYVTRDGLSGSSQTYFTSGFTTNFLPIGWTVTQRTYVDAGNALYTGSLLGTAAFFGSPGLQTASSTNLGPAGGNPFSVTERYTITATGAGSNNSTISLSAAVPEPGTWALMIMGFGGAGAMLRSRRRQAAVA